MIMKTVKSCRPAASLNTRTRSCQMRPALTLLQRMQQRLFRLPLPASASCVALKMH